MDRVSASFRDPAGFVYRDDGRIFRQINAVYAPHYRQLLDSGLAAALGERGWLLPFEERPVEMAPAPEAGAFRVVESPLLPFVSHPYEWSFSMLRDAALLTLDIQLEALARGMTLKDASAYNVQFDRGRPVFIDLLSFEVHEDGCPWLAYRQFCQHFLAPLALAVRRDPRLMGLLLNHLDGIPLDLAASLLPWRTRLEIGLGVHLHAQARSLRRHQCVSARELDAVARRSTLSRRGLLAIVNSLRDTVAALQQKHFASVWRDYYQQMEHYGDGGLEDKRRLVGELLAAAPRGVVWDLGANTGQFSCLAATRHPLVVAWDFDPACVEALYLHQVKPNRLAILPLVANLASPSPGIGWAQQERAGMAERGPCDIALALGLMHHLVLSQNVPLAMLADFLHAICRRLIIEFVPLEDPQASLLVARHDGKVHVYDEQQFQACFARHFSIESRRSVQETCRSIYDMKAL